MKKIDNIEDFVGFLEAQNLPEYRQEIYSDEEADNFYAEKAGLIFDCLGSDWRTTIRWIEENPLAITCDDFYVEDEYDEDKLRCFNSFDLEEMKHEVLDFFVMMCGW